MAELPNWNFKRQFLNINTSRFTNYQATLTVLCQKHSTVPILLLLSVFVLPAHLFSSLHLELGLRKPKENLWAFMERNFYRLDALSGAQRTELKLIVKGTERRNKG